MIKSKIHLLYLCPILATYKKCACMPSLLIASLPGPKGLLDVSPARIRGLAWSAALECDSPVPSQLLPMPLPPQRCAPNHHSRRGAATGPCCQGWRPRLTQARARGLCFPCRRYSGQNSTASMGPRSPTPRNGWRPVHRHLQCAAVDREKNAYFMGYQTEPTK